jgi:hypothetical protein
LNDTNNFVSIDGSIRTITIRTKDFTNPKPVMDILINGDQNNQPVDPTGSTIIKLPGLKYDTINVFYCQSVDISGAKSAWLSSRTQPAPSKTPDWFVKKPKGKILIVDDYKQNIPSDRPDIFYAGMMDSLQLTNQYDVYDIYNQKPPYLNITFYETIKLFPCLLWYSDNDPSLDLANVTVQKYTNLGNKIFFSMQFPQAVDLAQVQGFLPITPDSAAGFQISLLSGRILSDTSKSSYPTLRTTASLLRSRAFWVSGIGKPIYYFSDNSTFPRNKMAGYMGFENTQKSIFFIGMPLHLSNGIPGSVQNLIHKVLKEDFNIIP